MFLRGALPPPQLNREKNPPTDPEVLQKMNEIIKDRSADCKPRKVKKKPRQ